MIVFVRQNMHFCTRGEICINFYICYQLDVFCWFEKLEK